MNHKVWFRDCYTETWRQWLGEMLLCHVYYKLCPPYFDPETCPQP